MERNFLKLNLKNKIYEKSQPTSSFFIYNEFYYTVSFIISVNQGSAVRISGTKVLYRL
jgi:hypothetical protein